MIISTDASLFKPDIAFYLLLALAFSVLKHPFNTLKSHSHTYSISFSSLGLKLIRILIGTSLGLILVPLKLI